MENKYLKITMYDNDFTSYGREFGEYIYTITANLYKIYKVYTGF